MDKKRDEAYDLRKIFEEIELDLIANMQRNLKRHEAEEEEEGFNWEQWQKAKLRALQAYRAENRTLLKNESDNIKNLIESAIRDSYNTGQTLFDTVFEKTQPDLVIPQNAAQYEGEGEPQENSFFKMNEKKLKVLEKSVKSDLDKAQHSVLRKMDDTYRKTIFKAENFMTAGTKTLDQAIDLATKDFLAQGINCIQYKNGRLVNVASYAEMALRTASHRAVLVGEGSKRDEWGIHTVVVSAHGNTCKLCVPWQGKVLIDDVFCGGTGQESFETGYPLLSTAIKAGLLHPNCRHALPTYFPGVTQLPKVPDAKQAVERNDAEQEQRRLERLIRKNKRVAEGSLDPDNIAAANDKVKDYQEQLRQHLKDNPYLRRAPSREQTRGISIINKNHAEKLKVENQEYIEKYSAVRYNEDGTVKVTDDWKSMGHKSIPREYKPNAIIETKETKSGSDHVNRTYYDEAGQMAKQIHTSNHGNAKHHVLGKNGEHVHNFTWDSSGKRVSEPSRELTEEERIENADILR